MSQPPQIKPPVPVDRVDALDIRSGTVTAATDSPTGKTRYEMVLDYDGVVPRVTSHGAFRHYPDNQLLGQRVATVVNLPRKQMKDKKNQPVYSDAYVIGAKSHKSQAIALQFRSAVPAGDPIGVVGRARPAEQVRPRTEYSSFAVLEIRVGRVVAFRTADRRQLEIDFGPEFERKVVAGPFNGIRGDLLNELVVGVVNVLPWQSDWGTSEAAVFGVGSLTGEVALLQPLLIPEGDEVLPGAEIY
jgi:tRNA-binding EMAP/Myf-like protein